MPESVSPAKFAGLTLCYVAYIGDGVVKAPAVQRLWRNPRSEVVAGGEHLLEDREGLLRTLVVLYLVQ